MDFELQAMTLAQAAGKKTDALIVLVSASVSSGSDALSALIAQARKAGDLPDKPGKAISSYRPAGIAATRVVLAMVNDAASVRSAVVGAVGMAKTTSTRSVSIVFAATPDAAMTQAAVFAGFDASYVFVTTKPEAEARSIASMTLGVPSTDAIATPFRRALAIAQGVEFTKEWGNRPANFCTPTMLGEAALTLAASHTKVEVLGPKEVDKLGMGSFAAVSRGSSEPLRFIVLRYQGAAKSEAPVVLVGKGITFDTGGVSLKPAGDMDEMKYDMCGAASVLGTFRALALLRPKINVVGLIPTCENMNDGKALKPGDVVTSMSGQTIEVLNTDAEGRLVLCDALTYAKRFKPTAVIDIATLTGACVVALGHVRSGLFTADETLAAELNVASESSGDLCWRMPLDDEYATGLKTSYADVANIGGRAGGAITAAKFLQRFTKDFPWAHLDIAGTAWKSGAAKGATGRPVGLLTTFILDKADAGVSAPVAATLVKPGKSANKPAGRKTAA